MNRDVFFLLLRQIPNDLQQDDPQDFSYYKFLVKQLRDIKNDNIENF